MYFIEEVSSNSFNEWLRMGLELWPDNTVEGLRESFTDLLDSKKEKSFVVKIEDKYIGFINLSIRSDYVEGSDSSPVGYIEGIYVNPDYRNQGIARLMVKKGEEWAMENGCKQMASDCELHNTKSYDFHLKVGFNEANRVISFIKDLSN